MDFESYMLFLQAFLSLAFVVGLMFLVAWLVRFLGGRSTKISLFKKVVSHSRLSVVEAKRLDARNTLALVRCDDDEYLLLLGASQNEVLNTRKVKKND